MDKGLYERYFKRLMDLVLSFIALIILSPVLLVVGILVKLKLGSPVIFKQERPGKDGEIFKLYKFKTMLDPQTRDGRTITDKERLHYIEEGTDILTDEERLTKFGQILRMTSLDELPELWNIFTGNMSIVGPRPLSTIYLPYYTKEEMGRHNINPGLTGLAQVNGRNATSWKERFEYDLEYIKDISFITDIKIIFKTVAVVFSREDIEQGNKKPEAFNITREKEWKQK